MRVGIYARVSTGDQSVEMQVTELKQFALARGWEIEVFEDRGFSGKSTARPAFKRLMEAAGKRRIDTVAVWKLDRFARSLSDLITSIQRLNELGVSFVSLKDGIDLTTSHGKLLLGILGSLAEFERDMIVSRVRAGLENARREGKKLGRPQKRDDCRIGRLKSEGFSNVAIARELGITEGTVRYSLASLVKIPQVSSSKILMNPGAQKVD